MKLKKGFYYVVALYLGSSMVLLIKTLLELC